MANLFDIPDSSDWLNTPLASFAQVESGLRCQVCKDFYKTPMITACAHTFCSLCIRHCYSNDHKCPACRTTGQEVQLRRNGVLEELVEAFQNARNSALEFARQQPSTSRSTSPKRKRDSVVEEDAADRPSKRTRSSSRRTAEPAVNAEPAEESRETISLLHDSDGEYQPGSDLVSCPICSHKVKVATINNHMDTDCPPKPRPKPSSTLKLEVSKSSRHTLPSKSSSSSTRLPYLSYNSMKEPALKKKLAELGLPTFGSKIDMQRRHTEWVAIWNSNCDAKHPKSTMYLLSDLNTWERTQGALMQKSSSGIGAAIKDENFDGSGWAATHHNEFEDLIAKARQKRPNPKSTPASDLPTSTSSSEPVAPPDTLWNHEAVYRSPYLPSENPPETQNPSKMGTEVSLNSKENEKQARLTMPKEHYGIEPPFPSSQISHLKTSDEPTTAI